MIDVVATSLALRTGRSRMQYHTLQQTEQQPAPEIAPQSIPEISPPERGPDITPQQPPEITPDVTPEIPRHAPERDESETSATIVVSTWRRIRHGAPTSNYYATTR